MRILSFVVQPEHQPPNVRTVLYRNGVSRRLLIRLKHLENGILLNGQHIRVIDPVQAGDVVTLQIPDDPKPALPQSTAVPVLFWDEDVIALDKPPFMVCHPSRNHQSDTLANAFAGILEQAGQSASFRPLNRLDRDTSGVLIAALNEFAAAKLTRGIQKEYWAVCHGQLQGFGTIDLPIARVNERSILREVSANRGVPAVTHWQAVESNGQATLLRLWLETGRTHQIRVHCSFIGHPLYGDDFYGAPDPQIPRQALHCALAQFCHPVSHETVTVRSPLPVDMAQLFHHLGFSAVGLSAPPLWETHCPFSE